MHGPPFMPGVRRLHLPICAFAPLRLPIRPQFVDYMKAERAKQPVAA